MGGAAVLRGGVGDHSQVGGKWSNRFWMQTEASCRTSRGSSRRLLHGPHRLLKTLVRKTPPAGTERLAGGVQEGAVRRVQKTFITTFEPPPLPARLAAHAGPAPPPSWFQPRDARSRRSPSSGSGPLAPSRQVPPLPRSKISERPRAGGRPALPSHASASLSREAQLGAAGRQDHGVDLAVVVHKVDL